MSSFQDSSWIEEYIHGIKHEIYAVTFSDSFVGLTFLECSKLIYTRFGATLFSIGIYRMTERSIAHSQLGSNTSPFQIFLNPQDYKIKGNEIGFIICDNAEITVKMSEFVRFTRHDENSHSYADLITQPIHNLFANKNEDIENEDLKYTKVNIKGDQDDDDDDD